MFKISDFGYYCLTLQTYLSINGATNSKTREKKDNYLLPKQIQQLAFDSLIKWTPLET